MELWFVYLVELELLRSDVGWVEIGRDSQGRSFVELPNVTVVSLEPHRRVLAIETGMKFKDYLLSADLSPVFKGWVPYDVSHDLSEGKVIYTLVKQRGEVGYEVDSISDVVKLARSTSPTRLPLSRLEEMRLDSHSLVVGATGAGKSFFLTYLVTAYLAKGWNVVIVDPKHSDLSMLAEAFGLASAVDSDRIVSLVSHVYNCMEGRKVKTEGSRGFGQTAMDVGLRGVLLIVDEYASLSLKLDKSQAAELNARLGSIVLEGRQLGIHVALCMQQASSKVLPTTIREQLGNRFVLGQSGAQTYVTAFGQEEASSIEHVKMKAGQAWFVTEGVSRPRWVQLPWIKPGLMDQVSQKSRLNRSKKKGGDNGLAGKGG